MSEKKIIVDISEDGQINAETFGFQGVNCVAELDKLLKGIALEVTVEKKPEYYDESRIVDGTVKVKR